MLPVCLAFGVGGKTKVKSQVKGQVNVKNY
jgi:hypothetical protein